MRKIFFGTALILTGLMVYAGDIANFVNLGFSEDGTRFAFGQYGVTDEQYRAYAEIYGVDVERNEFLPKGFFRSSPTKETEGKDAKELFFALQNRAAHSLDTWGISDLRKGRVLYVPTAKTEKNTTFLFRDFETNTEYGVVLHVTKNLKKGASFYISLEITTPNGKKVKKDIGRPNFNRAGVRDYFLKRVIIDESGQGLVFIVEKQEYNPKGHSSRFMAETIRP